uniref:Uncharacterized protein n=1 Tax=Anguilla anguilla TaxID=7936 RepID=A0A0E9XLI0_ANGAN
MHRCIVRALRDPEPSPSPCCDQGSHPVPQLTYRFLLKIRGAHRGAEPSVWSPWLLHTTVAMWLQSRSRPRPLSNLPSNLYANAFLIFKHKMPDLSGLTCPH